MKINYYSTPMQVLYVALVVLFFLLLISLGSCEVLKTKRTLSKDSAAVHKIDSGAVRRLDVTTKSNAEWWREIFEFSKGKDTTINNITTPVNNYYPTRYIRESGTVSTETKAINYDSLWNNKLDSLVATIRQTDKSKETSTPAWLTGIIIFGFIFLLMLLVLLGVIIYKKFKQ